VVDLLPLLAVVPMIGALLVLSVRNPLGVALPAYAAVIPFGGLLSVGASGFSSLSSALGIALGAGLILQLMSARRVVAAPSPTVALWLMFLGLAGFTVWWSITPSRTASGFVILTSLVLVYVLVALSPADRGVLTRVENALILGGLVAVGYGLTQFLFLGGFPANDPGGGLVEGGGRFGNDLLGPNNEAVALLLPLMVALSRSVTLSRRSVRLFHVAIATVLALGIVMTGSRGGLIATFAAFVALAFVTPGGKAKLLAGGAVGAALVAVVFFAHPGGLATRDVQTTSSSGRTDIWKVGLAACPQYCLGGAGWETFPDVYAATQASVPDAEVLVGGGTYEPHNVWLLALIELGLPGLLLLDGALGMTFVEAVRLPARLRGPPLSGLVGTVLAAFFLSNLEFKFFWMSLMIVAVSRNVAVTERASLESARQPSKGTVS